MNMLSASPEQFLSTVQLRLHERITTFLNSQPFPAEHLKEAIAYVLKNSGKHFRPGLIYALTQSWGSPLEKADDLALAIELTHTYSLVHDDLPAMDNDDLRRGKATCHIAYDEATAILVGDSLQALAFQIIADSAHLTATQKVAAISQLATSSGMQGMVAGQALDLKETGHTASREKVNLIHHLKTGKLISCCIEMGIIACEITDTKVMSHLRKYGELIGLAFQVQDDILDSTTSTALLGKQTGKDLSQQKNTYVSSLGLKKAQEEAENLIASAEKAVSILGENSSLLKALARFVIERTK